jgi:hypothetical protein
MLRPPAKPSAGTMQMKYGTLEDQAGYYRNILKNRYNYSHKNEGRFSNLSRLIQEEV